MKIQVKTGNLFNITAGHIVHGCNAQGVMGSGVALGVKNLYPAVYEDYRKIHETVGLKLGTAYPVSITHPVYDRLMVWNAITQDNFGAGIRQTSYDAVETCFRQIDEYISENARKWTNVAEGKTEVVFFHPAEIHIPLIGAARGGGNWEIIREIIEQTVTHPVTLWLPDETVVGTL